MIGAGRVGRRKIAALLECGAAGVVALDPFADAEKLQVFVEDSRFCFERRPFREEDMAGKALVFICTSSREVNRTAAAACRARNVLCNVADAPHEGAFIVPSHVDAPPLSLALSTGGASPALARALKEDLETWLGLGSDRNAEIFRALCSPEFRSCFRAAYAARDHKRILRMAEAILPPGLHGSLKELLNGLD